MTFLAELEAEPWRFDFFATLRRIERSFPDRPRIGQAASRRDEYVVLGEDPFLEFAAANLSRVDRDAFGRVRIFTRFLGLLGPQGALPLATTEETFHWWLARDDAFPRFLDLFNHRFLQLFFRAWADARPIAQHDRPEADRFMTYVGAMIGLGTPLYRGLDAAPDEGKLAFAGLMAPKARSASRLEHLVSGMFGIGVEVEEFVGFRLAFEEGDCSFLGRRHSALGVDMLLGASVFSVEDKIRLRLFVPSLAEYERFLPQGDRCEPLADLVYFYLGDELDWDVELVIAADQVEPARLSRFGRLGWTTWIAPPRAAGAGMRRDARFHPGERVRQRREKAARNGAGREDHGRYQP